MDWNLILKYVPISKIYCCYGICENELLLTVHNVLLGHKELISNHYRIREYPETKKVALECM